ncbi:MAG: nitrilase-related carbon-nitrogen hydrolase [Planctomycetota bacterium]
MSAGQSPASMAAVPLAAAPVAGPRYYAAAMQTSLPALKDREGVPGRVAELVKMAEGTLAGYAPFHDVRLFVFPEFVHCAPMYVSVAELLARTAVRPEDHVAPYERFCKANGVFVQTGSFIEHDPKYPGAVFNTTLLVGPTGVLARYRKVNPWIPWEVHASPHDIPGYAEELFPVADTEIGRLGCAICYDRLFPEALRQLAANGAEVLIRVSAYMDPWGAQPPMDWWTLFNRARAAENTACVGAANQAANVPDYPPFSWPGGSMVVDYDGRVLAQAEPGPFTKVVVGPIDIGALRAERTRRMGHDMLGHLRTEAYTYMNRPRFPGQGSGAVSIAANDARIRRAKG